MKFRALNFLTFIFIGISTHLFAQVGVNTTTPDPSSILDISSTNKGVLTPRMTSTQRMNILNPANGLLVFDTNENAFYFYNTNTWVKLITEISNSDYTGWADYVDNQYTSANPFDLAGGVEYTLPNNAATTRDSQKPIDVTTFYDSSNSTITGRNGDGINIVIEFKAKPKTSSVTRVTLALDLGGSVGKIYPRDFVLAKGSNVEHFYLSSFNAYTLGTWETNGATVKVSSSSASEIYDIRYVITRTHKAR